MCFWIGLEKKWFGLVYDNSEFDTYYCPELVKEFYTCIDTTTIDLDNHQFTVHFDTGDIIVTIDMIENYTQVPSSPQHNEPLPLIGYMVIRVPIVRSKTVGLRLA